MDMLISKRKNNSYTKYSADCCIERGSIFLGVWSKEN